MVLPLFDGIIKDAEPLVNGFQTTDNVWICKALGSDIVGDDDNCGEATFVEIANGLDDVDTCNDDDTVPADGFGCQRSAGPDTICGNADDVSASSDWDGDMGDLEPCGPSTETSEGLGAFEFQIKFDHKLFQHPAIACNNDVVLDYCGRTVMGTVDVVTENWVLVGCASKANSDGDAFPGDPAASPYPGFSIAPRATLLVTVTFEIQPDLLARIRPTKDNGVRTDLLDENCELADTLGSPYNMAVEANGSNNAPAGGLTDDCGDLTLTIRMLEGDIDLNCAVDVVDDQMIAFRYGAAFGVLAYDSSSTWSRTRPGRLRRRHQDLQFARPQRLDLRGSDSVAAAAAPDPDP